MLFGSDGQQVPGQGQPNWSPAEFLQNLSNFVNGNEKALAWLQQNFQGVLTPAQWWQLTSYFVAWQTYRAVNWTLRSLRFLLQLSPLLAGVGLNLAIGSLAAVGPPAGLAGLAGIPAPGCRHRRHPRRWRPSSPVAHRRRRQTQRRCRLRRRRSPRRRRCPHPLRPPVPHRRHRRRRH